MSDQGRPQQGEPVRRRVFLALWPSERVRIRLKRATRRVVRRAGGRPTLPANLHMTVAFIGGVDAPFLERIRALAPARVGPIRLVMDRLGYWPQPRILWLGPTTLPQALIDLERETWAYLSAAGFAREPRPYRPHLTLARRANAVTGPVTAVSWSVRRLALVESVPQSRGARYRPLRFWELS